MAKKNSIISLIFILLSLFSFIQTIDPINVNVDTDDVNWLEYYKEDKGLIAKVADSKNKEIRYAVEFHIRAEPTIEYSGPFYIKIEVSLVIYLEESLYSLTSSFFISSLFLTNNLLTLSSFKNT